MWTEFYDMYSGGNAKEKWTRIFIEAREDDALAIFYNRFGHNPYRVTCTCCGPDYSIHECETIERYIQMDNVLIIPASEIKPEERVSDIGLDKE